ncbi:MAG: family 1 encapsulin nanocompartment shell protein [Actinomycetales bacterium]
MSTDHLLRGHAPISDADWALLDQEAKDRLTVALGARRLIDFSGPHGWTYSATNLGRTDPVTKAPASGVRALRRRVLPLTEVRGSFSIDRAELANNDRGAADVDLDSLDVAALEIATAENVAVFHGWSAAGIEGITEATPHPAVPRVTDFNDYPKRVAQAVATLRQSGISGPFGLALGPDDYTAVVETTEHGGYPLFDHVRKILGDGPLVWTPGVRGAVVVSLRGGDFLFESGQDLSLGYQHHDADSLHLYLEQSFSFRVATPEAAIALAGD